MGDELQRKQISMYIMCNGKIKIKRIPKTTQDKDRRPGEQLFIDIRVL